MTRSESRARGSQHRMSSGSSSFSPEGTSSRTRRQYPSHPPQRSVDVTDVEDASRLLECSQIARQLLFQHLVRHYLSQILHGCISVYCTTPTCLTCNKRLVSRPFRPPTQLTARTLAYYLASQEDPRRGLCPHELKVDPKSFAIQGADGVNDRQDDVDFGRVCNGTPRTKIHMFESVSTDNASPAGGEATKGEQEDVPNIIDAIAKRHQLRKDPKSLGQNLYDTVTVILSFSEQIPNPASIIASLRSTTSLAQPSAFDAGCHNPVASSDSNSSHSTSDPIFTDLTAGHTALHAVNGSRSSTSNTPLNSNRDSRQPSMANADSVAHSHTVQRLSYSPQDPLSLNSSQERSATQRPSLSTSVLPNTKMPIESETETTLLQSRNVQSKDIGKEDSKTRLALLVASRLTCDIMDQFKEGVYHRSSDRYTSDFAVNYDAKRRLRPATAFVNRSIFFALSDPETLLRSFRDQSSEDHLDSPLPHLDTSRLTHAFRDWDCRNGALVFDSLWTALEILFRPPPELDTQKSPRLKPSRKDATSFQGSERLHSLNDQQNISGRYLSNEEVAHIVMICMHALTSLVPDGRPHTWVQLRRLRGWGVVIPTAAPQKDFTEGSVYPWLSIVDGLEYEPAVRLADRLLSGIGARMCFEHVLASLDEGDDSHGEAPKCPKVGSLMTMIINHLRTVERVAIRDKTKMKVTQNTEEDPGWTIAATFMEWLRTIVIKKWNGNAEVHKWNSVGVAFTIFEKFHANMEALNLRKYMFHIPFLNERINAVQEPVEFLSWHERANSFHLFQYPFLFPEKYLVGYFRAINFTNMHKQFERSERASHLDDRMEYILSERIWQPIRNQLQTTFTDFLQLEVSRQDPLKETLDQLWGHEKRMLLKPLKIRIGTQEGEVGFDQGGVTYEFFRIVLNAAFDPNTGMFTVDSQTRMIWFSPNTFEPDWKFELLGVLFSLAVYNGITLPVTFPLAFYHYLLGPDHPHNKIDTSTTDYIRDGWPTLAKSFDDLLAFDGDVADVFMRDYTFSYEAFGKHVDKDMRAGASTVTNENREQFVKDYIEWLTYLSIKSQLAAFRVGFHACFHPKSLHLFTSKSLCSLIEGNPTISLVELQAATRYEDGYTATHPTIIDFWAIVQSYNQEQAKKLLEFVTASERVPVTGLESISFVIVRAGDDSERLPTSSTCFGKLMLPEYEGMEKMRRKLELALGNAKGFGVV